MPMNAEKVNAGQPLRRLFSCPEVGLFSHFFELMA